MKAEELRIGNYIDIYNHEYKIGLIAAKTVGLTFINKQILECSILDINPIPITEEWLLKFGFYYQASDKNYVVKSKQENYNSIKKIDSAWCYNNDDSDAACYFVAELKYIHQLQNLYYALNEEELICE